MADADSMRFNVLDVGQGSGNFIEFIKAGKTVSTALIDLGSERAKDEAGGPSVKYIIEALKKMDEPYIEFIALSHSDSDHINLILELLENFKKPGTSHPPKDILTVGNIFFGGPRKKYTKHSNENVIAALVGYQETGGKLGSLPSNACSYYGASSLYSMQGADFYLLVGNHVKGADRNVRKKIADGSWKTDSYSLNTYSLVFVVVFAGWQYVVTGDATCATIQAANYYIKEYSVVFPNVALLTMPHHASETTTFSMSGQKKRNRSSGRVSKVGNKVIKAFSDCIKPKTIHASAEDVGSFQHPSAFVMSYFWDHVATSGWYGDPTLGPWQHYYNAYFDEDDGYHVEISTSKKEPFPPFDDWWTLATEYAIFTNRYYIRSEAYDPDEDETVLFPPEPGKAIPISKDDAATVPPYGVSWIYETVKSTGKTNIRRVNNRDNVAEVLAAPPYFSMSKSDLGDGKTTMQNSLPSVSETPEKKGKKITAFQRSDVGSALTGRMSFNRLRSLS